MKGKKTKKIGDKRNSDDLQHCKGKKEKIKKEIKNELSSLSIFSFSIPLSYLSVLALAFASMDDVDLQARKEIKDELTKKEKMQQ